MNYLMLVFSLICGSVLSAVEPPSTGELFQNPFNRFSSHHRPIGAGAEYGVPGGTLDWMNPNPVYDKPGPLDSRGRLAIVKTFRCGSTVQGRKYLFTVEPTDPVRNITWHHDGGTGKDLPWKGRMPEKSDRAPYPSGSGDREVLLYPMEEDGLNAMAHVLAQFDYMKNTARALQSYPLSGMDVKNLASDPGDFGPGAIRWRHPGGFLRGFEVDPANPKPITHRLNATATCHSGKGATAAQHILSRTVIWPAWSTDLPLINSRGPNKIPDNQGDLPYGTIVCIRKQDAHLRDKLGLSEFGKVLFDTFLYYGCCLCDGQGQVIQNAPVLQLRVDYQLAADSHKVSEVDDSLSKILPHLYPLRNPRPHNKETEIWTDGLPYAGGGGPIDPTKSVNNAWDAK